MSTTVTSDTSQYSMKDIIRAAVSGWAGTALEYVDFQLYGLAAALVFNHLFFPGAAPGVAVVAAIATYATGYFVRPLGALFFGRMGDRYGRKHVLVVTIILMGSATTLIGVLPTYEQIGIAAPILLVCLRLLQGFGAGGELSGASVLMCEYSPANRRGLVGSLVGLGTNSGTFLASGIWSLLIAVLPSEDLMSWGWRIPFLGSCLILAFALWVRRKLKESPVFVRLEQAGVVEGSGDAEGEAATALPGADEKKSHSGMRAVVIAFLLRFGMSGNYGIITVSLVAYLATNLGVDKSVGANALMIGSVASFAVVPLVGTLSDRIGRRLSYIIFSIVTIVLIVPTMLLINSVAIPLVFVGFVAIYTLGPQTLTAVEPATLAEVFGARNRFTRMAVTREFGGFGVGLGSLLASSLIAWTGHWWAVAIEMLVFALCALGAGIAMREVAGRDLTDLRDGA
ncbi:MFS transporter [Brooklawnia cerclae]|uniref:MHS family metabolite:H+ symporter-like MFS transporter n=1 Tax=Brooklawnia cerclae TaxID=349934 RepID=A0ABX0SAJ5_9ACTN|nr:MFS transporter [Brooklawnia cerclae]NIH55423.1 MHS family metabolite:H+ symporter-like MFS transporter [Brooklawnia cerclae]